MMNNFEDLIEKEYSNIAGIAIRKDNHLIYEKYFDEYTQDDALHIASVTKSIISILIGMAIDKGYMKNIEQHVLDFFFRLYSETWRKNHSKHHHSKFVVNDCTL